jgi:hypothetical protein
MKYTKPTLYFTIGAPFLFPNGCDAGDGDHNGHDCEHGPRDS